MRHPRNCDNVQDTYDAIGCAVWPSSRHSHKPITIHNPFSMRLWEPCVIPPELAPTRSVIQISSFTHPRFRKRDQHATRLSCDTLRRFPLFRRQLRVLLFICISSHTLLTPSRGRLCRAAIDLPGSDRPDAEASTRKHEGEKQIPRRIHRIGPVFHAHGVRRMTTIGRKKSCRFQ